MEARKHAQAHRSDASRARRKSRELGRVDGRARQERGAQPVQSHGICVFGSLRHSESGGSRRGACGPGQLSATRRSARHAGEEVRRCAGTHSPRSTPGATRIRDSSTRYVCQDLWLSSATRSGLLPWDCSHRSETVLCDERRRNKRWHRDNNWMRRQIRKTRTPTCVSHLSFRSPWRHLSFRSSWRAMLSNRLPSVLF